LPEPFEHGIDTCRRQFQAIEQRSVESFLSASRHVLAISLKKCLPSAIDMLGYSQERRVLLTRRRFSD
jgi:hypothetical protein